MANTTTMFDVIMFGYVHARIPIKLIQLHVKSHKCSFPALFSTYFPDTMPRMSVITNHTPAATHKHPKHPAQSSQEGKLF